MEKISQHPNTFYRVSLKAVIRDGAGRILVVKENGSEWTLPGGGWDHGESERDCLMRELLEEVGYGGDFTYRPIATQSFYMPHRQAWLLWVVYEVTIPNLEAAQFSVGVDADAIAWMEPTVFAEPASEGQQWIYENV